MINDGKEYELFVAKVQQAIINSEEHSRQKNIIVEVNKKLIDSCGIERQFDVYWEFQLGGLYYKTIIECKDYQSKISIDKVDGLIGKLRDLPDVKGLIATSSGFQSGAEKKAQSNKIDLLIVREQNDNDWRAQDGTPLLKIINIKIHAMLPARITRFEPVVDGAWIKANTDLDITEPLDFLDFNNAIIINDGKSEFSLYDLEKKLSPLDGKKFGTFNIEKIIFPKDGFIKTNKHHLKLHSYKVEYQCFEPLISEIEIDGSKELLAVVEYLNQKSKRIVFKDGRIKHELLED